MALLFDQLDHVSAWHLARDPLNYIFYLICANEAEGVQLTNSDLSTHIDFQRHYLLDLSLGSLHALTATGTQLWLSANGGGGTAKSGSAQHRLQLWLMSE